MLNHVFPRRTTKAQGCRFAPGKRRRTHLGMQELENRRLLALLDNGGLGRTEAFLQVEVNEYGAFGNAIALDVARGDVPNGNTIGNAFYDPRDPAPPTPPIESVGYAYESAIAIGTNFTAGGYTREFLTAGCVNYHATRTGNAAFPTNACADIREGNGFTAPNNPTDAQFDRFTTPPQGIDNRTSVFYYPNGSNQNNAEIRITLHQELIEHSYLGGPSGTSLVQTYELEILSSSVNNLEIVRYMDADVFEPGSPIADGGGHRSIGVTIDQDAVFTTNNATGTPLNDVSIVEIHENHVDYGGYPQLGTNRWEIGRATGNDAGGLDFNPPWPPVCLNPCKTHPWLDIWPVSTYTPPDANGDAIKPRAHPIVPESPYLVARIMAGVPLANDITVHGGWTGPDFNGQTQTYGQPNWDPTIYDADGDDVIDAGASADVAMAMSNQYVNVNQGDRIVYQVFTKFGHPPIGNPPPPPTTADVSGRLFADLNGDGVFDPNEPPLQGWTVFNDRNGDGDIDPGEIQTQTASDGTYLLKLPENTGHNIALLQRPNWTQTRPLGVGLTAPGSYGPLDVGPNDLGTRLDPGAYGFPDFNFGVDPDPSTIFGFVFEDENNNRQFDPGEAPLPNWTVYADLNHDGVQQINEFATTDAAGRYEFTNVNPGTYTVVSTAQPDYQLTTPASGQFTVTVGAGANVQAGNFGYRLRRASISGLKFHDINNNGVRDVGEPGLSNVYVFLDLNNDGKTSLGEPARFTDSQGRFTFTEVRPRVDLVLRESPPLGMHQTFPTDNGGAHLINLEPGEALTGVLFGNRFVTVDYGDAPAPYPTSIQANGPAHEVDPDIRLGATVTAESVPAINATASGDSSDDGVVLVGSLTPGATSTVQVTASQAGGFLQGWIDFNRDGDWNDAGEQIFINQPLSAGATTLNFAVPASAVPGVTFARYRYSTEMNLGLTGLAADGEVEDYQYTIAGSGGGGELPTSWTNPANQFDVNGDGNVTPADALAIVSALRTGGARELSPPSQTIQPPPYIDVNGDNRLTINDAMQVIRQIILLRSGSGEGEGEGLAVGSQAAVSEEPLPTSMQSPAAAPAEAEFDARHDLAVKASLASSRFASTSSSRGVSAASESEELEATLDSISLDVCSAWK